MTQWLHDRYISRDEHQQIVEYYRKLVGNLQHTICQLKTQVDLNNIKKFDDLVEHITRSTETESWIAKPVEHSDNVIRFDFRKRTP